MRKNFESIFVLGFVLTLFGPSLAAHAAQSYQINNGTSKGVDEWGTPRVITNNSGISIFVPTNSSAEWSAFLAHMPAGVSAVIPTLNVGGTVYNYSTGAQITLAGPWSNTIIPNVGMNIKVYGAAGGGGGNQGADRGGGGGGGGGGAANIAGYAVALTGGLTYRGTVGVGGVNRVSGTDTYFQDSGFVNILYLYGGNGNTGCWGNCGVSVSPGGTVAVGTGITGGSGGAGGNSFWYGILPYNGANGGYGGGTGGGGGGGGSANCPSFPAAGGNGGNGGNGAIGGSNSGTNGGNWSGLGGTAAYQAGGGGGGGGVLSGYGYGGGGGGGADSTFAGQPPTCVWDSGIHYGGAGGNGVLVLQFVSLP